MAKLYPFSKRMCELLSRMPVQGECHRWLAQVAGGLSPLLSREQCFDFLRAVCDQGVRHREVPDREIEGAVNLAYEEQSETANSGQGSLRWPIMDDALVRDTLAKTTAMFSVEGSDVIGHSSLVIGEEIEDGKQRSEVRAGDSGMGINANVERRTLNAERRRESGEDTGLGAGEVLQGLFRPGELVCAGASSDRPKVRAVEAWLEEAEQLQFVVVNPMRASFGKNKQGEISVRCQSNVRFRRHVVAEFDDLDQTKEMQAQLLTALSRLAPLVLVVDSGGKSLHGWFRVEELGARDQVRFFAACCALGADRTRWDICGWLRMPGGTRPGGQKSEGGGQESGVRQRILFWDKGYGIKDKGVGPSTRGARSGRAMRGGGR